MTPTSPVEAVLDAAVDTLAEASGVSGVASVWNNVPQGTSYPYLEVTTGQTLPQHTLGAYGAITEVMVTTVSQARGDAEASQLAAASVSALAGQRPALINGHRTLGIALRDLRPDTDVVISGIVTRRHVALFHWWTEQTTS